MIGSAAGEMMVPLVVGFWTARYYLCFAHFVSSSTTLDLLSFVEFACVVGLRALWSRLVSPPLDLVR